MTPPKPKYISGKTYWPLETDKAIIRYNQETDPEIRSRIYENEIHYSFWKLTENLIHTFKFYNTEVDNLEDLQHEVIIFLLSKIDKFDPSLGYKAYSYFGLIAKRYLILSDGKNYKKKVSSLPLDNIESSDQGDITTFSLLSPQDKSLITIDEDEAFEPNDDYKQKLSDFIDDFVEYCLDNIYELFPNELDAKIADAILELFKKRQHIEIFNKKALYFSIRERVDVKAPKITKVAQELYKIFKEEYINYLDSGYYNFKEPHIYKKT